MSTKQQKTKQKRNTPKKETTLDLTYESVDEILQTSRSFGVLAYMGYKGIPISTDQKSGFLEIRPSVILFNIHNSFELLLKTLHHLKSGKMQQSHTLQKLYNSEVIQDFRSELDDCYKETLEEYEQNIVNIDRKIVVDNLEKFQEYDKSSFNNTLNTLDNMKLCTAIGN